MYKSWLFLAVALIGSKSAFAANGTFWHISDIHVDQNYSRTGDPEHFCHESTTRQLSDDIGLYGNFLCDSPQILVNVTVESMTKLEPNPDFIIWTGDNLPHVWNPDPGWDTVYEALNDLTELLQLNFNKTPIYPCIGNHDSFPPNILLPRDSNNSVYSNYLQKGGWKNLIPKESWNTFSIGGYYSAPVGQGLTLISLNTILWYETNKNVTDMTDPAGQLKWLEDTLKNASSRKDKVYIIGHVAPGFYNKAEMPLGSIKPITYHPQFLKQYLDVTKEYYMTIAGQFFGHFHLDTFQLFQYDSGVTRSSSLLASSVTPWHSKKHGGLSLAVNPSIRLMHYELTNGTLLDYDQYFLNLTEVNKMAPNKTPEYELLYKFTDAYKVADVSTASLYEVYEKLKSSDKIFDLFNHYMTAGKDSLPCDEHCKTAQLCAMICTSLEEYLPCMRTSDEDHTSSHTTLYAIMGSLIVILVVISLFAFVRLRKKGSRTQRQYEQFSEF